MNSYEYQKLRGLKRKVELINLKGGCCQQCGYNKNLSAFEFHHIDPSVKDFQLDMRKLSNSTMESILIEVEKCILLCSNCHKEIHSPDLEMSIVLETIKDVSESVTEVKKIGKPKCIDCDCEINYTYTRCISCSNKQRFKERPDLNLLQQELDEHSATWCGQKYGVSRTTIKRWLNNQ